MKFRENVINGGRNILFLVQVSVLNSKIIYEKSNNVKVNELDFLTNIISKIYKNYELETWKYENNTSIPFIIRNKLHNMQHIPGSQKRCVFCGKKVVYKYKECNKAIHPQCFTEYHNFIYNKIK